MIVLFISGAGCFSDFDYILFPQIIIGFPLLPIFYLPNQLGLFSSKYLTKWTREKQAILPVRIFMLLITIDIYPGLACFIYVNMQHFVYGIAVRWTLFS